MAREVGLQELLNASFTSGMNNVYTAIPCIVVSVDDPAGQIVSIQPTVNQRLKDGTVRERTVIRGVPVAYLTSDKSGMTFPLNAGVTTGMAIFSMRSMETWKSGNGKPVTPNNFAKFDKSDAVFYPGLTPPGTAPNNPAKHFFTHSTDDLVVFHNLGTANEIELRLRADGSFVLNTNDKPVEVNGSDITVNASNTITLNAPQMAIDVGQTLWIGNIDITGTATFNGIPFDTHRHTGVTPGSGTSGGPTA